MTRSRSQTDQYDDELHTDLAFYVDYTPYSPFELTTVQMPAFIAPYYPYLPVLDNDALKECIKKQIEYYFSEENLQRDFFLRRKMDDNGYLPISLIASFHRVQALTQDVQMIVDAISDSTQVELLEGIKVRTRINPEKWPLVRE